MRARTIWPLLGCTLALAGCGGGDDPEMRAAVALTGGHPERAPEEIRRYGCASCHTIPGVPGADALVGPPLAGISRRMYIAGVLTNTPDHLVHWILDPQGVDSATAMPKTGVTEAEARDIAAYLYTLK